MMRHSVSVSSSKSRISRGRRAVRRECGRLVGAVRASTLKEVFGFVVLSTSLSMERASLKFAVDAADEGVLLVAPYVAIQVCGLMGVRCIGSTAGCFSQSKEAAKVAELAAEGANRVPRSKVALAAALDLLHLCMILGSIGLVPATLSVLLAHAAPPFARSCRELLPSFCLSRRSSQSSEESGTASTAVPAGNAAISGRRRKRAIEIARHALVVSSCLLLVLPRLSVAFAAAARGRNRKARAVFRRLAASLIYAGSHAPAQLSAWVKETALADLAEPVAYAQLNTVLAWWQLTGAFLILGPICIFAQIPSKAVSDAWSAVFDVHKLPSLLFLLHLFAGLAARLSPGFIDDHQSSHHHSSTQPTRVLLVDAAQAVSVPLGVIIVNILVDPTFLQAPFLLVADAFATLCVGAELALGPGRPTTNFVTKQVGASPELANLLQGEATPEGESTALLEPAGSNASSREKLGQQNV